MTKTKAPGRNVKQSLKQKKSCIHTAAFQFLKLTRHLPWEENVRKAIQAVSLSVALTAGFAQAQEAEKPHIPVIVKDVNNSFFQIVIAGAEAAGRELDLRIEPLGAESEQDVAGQVALLEKAVADHADAVVIAPTSYEGLGLPIDEAAKVLPVVVINSAVASQNFSAYLATDNRAASAMAADALAAAIGVPAVTEGIVTGGDEAAAPAIAQNVAIVNFIEGAGSLIERSAGFKDELFARYPSLTVVDEVFGTGSSDSVRIEVEKLLLDHPEIVGIYATNIFTTEVVGELLVQKALAGKVRVIGWDSSDKIVALLEDGTVQGAIVQDPFRMGYDGVKAAFDLIEGRGVLREQDTGAELITKANMNGETEQRLLNPPMN